MRRLHLPILSQAGDTIVEVMIVLAILGLALSISYATANRGIQQSRNAQEHSEALGIIDSQVELLRSYVIGGGNPSTLGSAFCMVDTPALATQMAVSSSCTNINSLYNVSITYKLAVGPAQPYYDFVVTWPGLGSLGSQQEEIAYRI